LDAKIAENRKGRKDDGNCCLVHNETTIDAMDSQHNQTRSKNKPDYLCDLCVLDLPVSEKISPK
jgi:hypothetical protein